jgi:hypothetical protein
MKFGLIVLSLVASSGYAFVSQQSKWTRPSSPVSSTLMMATPTHHQHTGDWWQVAPAAMAIAGWAVAAQVSFAAAPMELAQPMSQGKNVVRWTMTLTPAYSCANLTLLRISGNE